MTKLSLEEAIASLDPEDDANWTETGLPRMEVLEALTGDKSLTRERVDGIDYTREKSRAQRSPPPQDNDHVADGAEKFPEPKPLFDAPKAEPAEQSPRISRGRMVDLAFVDPFDDEKEASGIVVKVNDDGTVNVKALAPNGGADKTFTGVRPTDYVNAMIEGADKNAAMSVTWSWPKRG